METREELIEWLRDAYAMERGLEVTLKKQSRQEDLEPTLRRQFTVHLGETSAHADAIEMLLHEMGAGTSAIKTGMGQGMAMFQGAASAFARDERVKDVLTAYASEHFEIACYTALRTGAELLGETAVVELCDSIIPDEEAMAEWLAANLPMVVTTYLQGQAVTVD
jgi:ferritin-like metal-binding protein YciE